MLNALKNAINNFFLAGALSQTVMVNIQLMVSAKMRDVVYCSTFNFPLYVPPLFSKYGQFSYLKKEPT